MKSYYFLLIILFLIGAGTVNAQLADSPWPMLHGNLRHTGLSPYNTSHVDGIVKWTFETGGGVESSPVIGSDGTIYVGSHDGYLYALNPDGTVRWKFKAGNLAYEEDGEVSKSILATPALAKDGTIYISGSFNYLFALTPEGKEKWRFFVKWDPAFWNGPTVGEDGVIYVANARNEGAKDYPGGVYALTPDGKEKWRFLIRSGAPSIPTIGTDGTIYINAADSSTNQGKIFALDPNGKLKWEFTMEQWQEGSSAIGADGTIYTGSKEGNVYAVTSEGKEKWRFKTGGGISADPAIGKDGTIYIGSWDGNFYALNPEGKELWHFDTKIGRDPKIFETMPGKETISASAAISADGTIYFGDVVDTFYALDLNGTEKWRFQEKGSGYAASPAIAKDGTIYIGREDGKVIAFSSKEDDFILTVQLANSPWPMHRGNPQHTGRSYYKTEENNGTLLWTFETGEMIDSSPAIASNGTIYIGSNDNKLYALNPNGSKKWEFSAGPTTYSERGKGIWGIRSSPAIGKDGTIYVGSRTTKFFAINPDGTEKWHFPEKSNLDVLSSPAIGSDGTIYFGSHEGSQSRIHALSPDGTEKWSFDVQSEEYSSPAISADGIIYFGSHSKKLYAAGSDGSKKWEFTVGDAISSSPAIGADGTIYIGANDKKLYAVNPDGKEKWHFVTNSAINSIPAIDKNGTIYVGSNDGTFYSIASDRKEKWKFNAKRGIESSATISADGTIYFGDNGGYFYAINPNGTEKWRFENLGHGFVSSPAISKDGTIYVGSVDKKVYAFGEPPTEEELKELESKVNESSGELITSEKSTIEQIIRDSSFIYVVGAVLIVIVVVIIK